MENLKKWKKELFCVGISMICGYLIQIVWVFFNTRLGINEPFLASLGYIPSLDFLMVFTPLFTWLLFAIFQVKWIKKWKLITTRAYAFVPSFLIIGMMAVFFKPSLWLMPKFWIIDAIISIILAFKFFKPLLTERFDEEE